MSLHIGENKCKEWLDLLYEIEDFEDKAEPGEKSLYESAEKLTMLMGISEMFTREEDPINYWTWLAMCALHLQRELRKING